MDAHARSSRRRRLIGALIFIVSVVGRSTLYAQVPTPALTVARTVEAAPAIDPGTDTVRLLVGRSTIVDVGKPIARVSLTSADVADAMVTSPNELLVNGKTAGTISMFVWDRAGAVRRFEVVVQRDLARLSAQLKELFPKESIEVRANGRTAVLSGSVSSKDVADKMASLAGSFVESKEELVSLLQIGPAGRSNQVLLQVRFAEVSRSAMTELGLGIFTSATGINNTIGRVTTQQFPAVGFEELSATKVSSEFGSDVVAASGKLTFSDFMNLFLFNNKYDLGVTIKALQSKGLFQSLAEPNLVAESGKEASFLAGGEFPIPIAQGSGNGTSISIQFKEFGIRLNFTPVVNGDRVHLKVRPEVSALDFSNAITMNGFRIPALSTRRTETEIELSDGQTFAIAGLMNNTMNSTMQKIPGIGDIPILGLLFKSKAAQKNQTELVVMITPHILRNDSPGVTPILPRLDEPFLPPLLDKEVVPMPPAAFQSAITPPVAPAATASASAPAATASAPVADDKPSAAAAAATMKAMAPGTRPVVRTPNPEPATPATAPAASASQTADDTNRPLSAEERRAVERARKEEAKQAEVEKRDNADLAKRAAQQAERDRREQQLEDERQAVLARAQAERDAETARRAEVAAKRQAEIDKKRGKAIAEADLKLRAAQAAYQAELAKQQ